MRREFPLSSPDCESPSRTGARQERGPVKDAQTIAVVLLDTIASATCLNGVKTSRVGSAPLIRSLLRLGGLASLRRLPNHRTSPPLAHRDRASKDRGNQYRSSAGNQSRAKPPRRKRKLSGIFFPPRPQNAPTRLGSSQIATLELDTSYVELAEGCVLENVGPCTELRKRPHPGEINSELPSVVRVSGVSAEICSISRIGSSITSARLLPCRINVLDIPPPCYCMRIVCIERRTGAILSLLPSPRR